MKQLSAEQRALLAGALSVFVLILWLWLFPANSPSPTPPPQTATTAKPAPTPAIPPPPATVSASGPAAAAVPTPAKAATAEKTIVVENGLYRVEFTNRGAVAQSWQLKKYTDDHKPPRTLDLVNREAARQTGGWPFSLALDDPQLESAANSALFEITPAGTSFQAPAEIQFEWSDGRLGVTKRLKFDRSYIVQIETLVTLDAQPLAHALAWRGGFGDTTVYLPAEQVQVFSSAAGKLDSLPFKKLGTPGRPAQRLRRAGPFDYVGIEDRYFAAAFLPHHDVELAQTKSGEARPESASHLALWDWTLERDIQQDGKPAKEPVAEMAAGSASAGPLNLRVFVGPKDLDDLKTITPPLTDLIQFGWLELIALPLFYLLEWIHRYIANYGWAIILMTVLINMLLFPLKVKSYRSARKMQKVQPEIKAIQDRYKKYSLRDPRKQEMNKEVMAVYNREGINPMGSCWPMLPQMPIWFALYRMLNVTIELRHAPWLGWVKDLSNYDPYYILPVLMTVTMYLQQKSTPMTATDPAQQKMMTLMPLFFGILFFRMSSGLVLYIFTSNLIGMAQQWYLNRNAPAPVKSPRGKQK